MTTNKTIFLSLCLALTLSPLTTIYAADFGGTLQGVTITDSSGTNTPPTAVIDYTKNGDVFNFDASGSADSDGAISEYKWDFGDGITGIGSTIIHTYTTSGSYHITLTVIDNGGGVSLSQQSVSTSINISDDFESDTINNYTTISGTLNIESGVIHGSPWEKTLGVHNLDLNTEDQIIEADIYYSGIRSDGGGLLCRVDNNGQTGYAAFFNDGQITLSSFSGAILTTLSYKGTYIEGVYKVRLECEGNNIRVFVDGSLADEIINDYASVGKQTGLVIIRTKANQDGYVDNFSASPY